MSQFTYLKYIYINSVQIRTFFNFDINPIKNNQIYIHLKKF